MLPPPPPPPPPKLVVLLDLDHTLIHMMSSRTMPESASMISEAVVSCRHTTPNGVYADAKIAVRKGCGQMLHELIASGVTVEIVTLNQVGDKVVEAIARSDAPYAEAWRTAGQRVTICRAQGPSNRHVAGCKKLPRAVDPRRDRIVILDDVPEWWCEASRPFVVEAPKFDVFANINSQQDFRAELEYLDNFRMDTLIKLLQEADI